MMDNDLPYGQVCIETPPLVVVCIGDMTCLTGRSV